MIPSFKAKSYDFTEFVTARSFIAGEWCDPLTSKATLEVLNPRHGKAMATVKMGGKDDVDAAVRAGEAAFLGDDPEVVQMTVVEHADFTSEEPKCKSDWHWFLRISNS